MHSRLFLAAVAVGMLAPLAACGQSNHSNATLPLVNASSYVPPRVASLNRSVRPDGTGVKRQGLAITSASNNTVVVLDSAYQPIETLTADIDVPAGDAYDAHRNLYVANYGANDVTEYSHSGRLISTYSTDVSAPGSVAVDSKGNVYVANSSSTAMTSVVEFPQGSNTPSVVCDTILNVNGIAVDAAGNVFVAGNWNTPKLVEYAGGLSGCNGTELGAENGLTNPQCITIDKNDNLVVGQDGGDVAVIDPPYSNISSSIGGFDVPSGVAISKSGAKLYVADTAAGVVWVVSYPSGTLITQLGSTDGATQPIGVAAFAYYNK